MGGINQNEFDEGEGAFVGLTGSNPQTLSGGVGQDKGRPVVPSLNTNALAQSKNPPVPKLKLK